MESIIEKYILGELSLYQILLIICLFYAIRLIEWGIRAAWEKWQNSKKPNSHDLTLWDQIKEIKHAADFWRERYIAAGSFPYQKLTELDSFVDLFRYNKPEMQFLSSKLEKLKAALVEKADVFRRAIAENTEQPGERDDRLKFSHDCPGDFFDQETTEKMNKIDAKANDFVSAFDALHEQVIAKLINKKTS